MLPAALCPLIAHVQFAVTAPVDLGLYPEPRWGSLFRHLLGEHDDEGRPATWWFTSQRRALTRVEPGELLAITLYWLPAANETMQRLLDALRALPAGAPSAASSALLGPNLRWHAQAPTRSLHDDLAREADELRGETELRWCTRSPVRWLAAAHRERRGEARYVHDERQLTPALLVERLFETPISLRRELDCERIALPALELEIPAAELFFTNLAYRNRDGRDKPTGGLQGEIIVRCRQGLSEAQATWLALTQHLGSGQRRGFGFGQFAFETLDGEARKHDYHNEANSLPRVASHAQLRAAYEHLRGDDEFASDAETGFDAQLHTLAERLQSPSYTPQPLHPAQIEKSDGSTRTLKIPPLPDRIAQRAILNAIAPSLDALMGAHSYGFRAGRSRLQARDRILALYEEGYRVVVESDVAAFFDNVDWWRVAVRLRAFLGRDTLVERILAYIAAPERIDGEIVERQRGLPQGAPLSPILSNLLLDDLD